MSAIPRKFYKVGIPRPTARTVGQLKAILAELPDELRVEAGFGEPMEIRVYNHGSDDEHLAIEAYDESEDEEGGDDE